MHQHYHLELHRQRAAELHRHAALVRLCRHAAPTAHAAPRRRSGVRGTRVYAAVARRAWALRDVPNLIP